jgi:hypothetical protein
MKKMIRDEWIYFGVFVVLAAIVLGIVFGVKVSPSSSDGPPPISPPHPPPLPPPAPPLPPGSGPTLGDGLWYISMVPGSKPTANGCMQNNVMTSTNVAFPATVTIRFEPGRNTGDDTFITTMTTNAGGAVLGLVTTRNTDGSLTIRNPNNSDTLTLVHTSESCAGQT